MPSSLKRRFLTDKWQPRPLTRRNAWKSELGEQKKVVVRDSITAALQCCLVHLVPILTSTLILFLNLHGLYIGIDFKSLIKSETINLLFLQIAAKVHEILIIASLSQIIFQLIRHELLFGHGLPLGLVGSGLAFGNFEFFFNKQFYGALKYLTTSGEILRRLGFVTVLIISGLVAALAGPVSAVLLVPKSQTWPSGGTDFYLNGTYQDFWPDDTAAGLPDIHQICSSENSTASGICPGGGYFSLWEHWGRLNYTNFYNQDVRPYAKKLSGSNFYWPVHSPDSLIPPIYALGDARKDSKVWSNTFLVQPHAATATMLQRIGEDWWNALLKNQHLDPLLIDDRQIQSLARIAITSARCTEPTELSVTENTVQFPTILGRFDYAANLPLELDNINQNVSNHLRFQWVNLPAQFGPASTGALFESPWRTDNHSRTIVGCTIQSGWIPATYLTDAYSFWSGWYPWNLQFGGRTPVLLPAAPGEVGPPTSGRIALAKEWLELLTPPAPSITPASSDWKPSTIETILENAGLAAAFGESNPQKRGSVLPPGSKLKPNDNTPILEAIISSIVVDGLSRSGSHRLFDTSGSGTEWSLRGYQPLADFAQRVLANKTALQPPSISETDMTRLDVAMSITGFSYYQSLVTYLSMSVLLIHMAMATAHITWMLLRKHTSRCWSTIAELIALAQNSQPTFDLLKNTGAGIQDAKTFSQIARIRVRPDPHTGKYDRVELVFDRPGRIDNHVDDSSSEMGIGLVPLRGSEPEYVHNVYRVDEEMWHSQRDSSLMLPSQPPLSSRRSVSRDRLIPRVITTDDHRANMVKINNPYG